MDPLRQESDCTLTSPRVADLLARLFVQGRENDANRRQMFDDESPLDRARRGSSIEGDYRELYGQARHLYLAVSPDTGRLIYMVARSIGARSIVEFGTSFGLSTICLAAALRDNGGGRLIGTELESGKIEGALANLAEAGLDDLVEIREGDALQTLSRDLPAPLDLVLLDGHKPLYPRRLALLGPQLRPGGCLIADNASTSEEYLARVRAADGGFLSVAVGGDVELSMKV